MEYMNLLAKRTMGELDEDEPDLTDFRGQVRTIEGGPDSDEEEEVNFFENNITNCIVCKTEVGKYKCPGCHGSYCKPACFTTHQKNKLCIKNKTPVAFKKLKDYKERDLMRDFNYLSGILEGYDKSRKKLSQIEISLLKHQEMVRYKILSEHAQHRGVRIRFAPRFMERHRENISFYFTKEKVLYWVFEIILVIFTPTDNMSDLHNRRDKKLQFKTKRFITNPICEDEPISLAIKEFPFSENDVLVYFGENIGLTDDIESKGAKIFVKNTYNIEKVKADMSMMTDIKDQIESSTKYVEVDSKQPIKRIICNINLQEYPTLYIVKAEDEISFSLYNN